MTGIKCNQCSKKTDCDISLDYTYCMSGNIIKRNEIRDIEISSTCIEGNFSVTDFIRVYAVDKVFKKVNFEKCVFKNCYFRRCKFIQCDFTGALFDSSNLVGSHFDGSEFGYSRWYRTEVDKCIIDNYSTDRTNLAKDFVERIRANFDQIGNYSAVNLSSRKLVNLTRVGLKKATFSQEKYYRDKYKGKKRILAFFDYCKFLICDFLWGVGESIIKLLLFTGVLILVFTLIPYFFDKISFINSLENLIYLFLGMKYNVDFPKFLIAIIILLRVSLFGLLVILISKKTSIR